MAIEGVLNLVFFLIAFRRNELANRCSFYHPFASLKVTFTKLAGLFAVSAVLLLPGLSLAVDVGSVLRIKPEGEILRADFRFLLPAKRSPSAVIVLCPGQNDDGQWLLKDERWKTFARDQNLGVVVPGFASPDADLESGRGYFLAERGSGQMLLKALSAAGWADRPLVLYGFSGGAHFAMSFAAWAPEKVRGFCAYSFGWWTPPPENLRCPALIACGQADASRYGASFAYFQAGRRDGRPWAWVSLDKQDHARSEALDSFVREYFHAVLASSDKDRVIVDNILKQPSDESRERRLTSSVLPSKAVLGPWRILHRP